MSSCPCPGPLGPAPPGVGEGFKPSPTMPAGEQACGNPGSGAGLRYAPDTEPEVTPGRRGGFQTLPYYNAGRRAGACPGPRSGARGAGVQDRRPLFSDRHRTPASLRLSGVTPWARQETVCGGPARAGAATGANAAGAAGTSPVAVDCMGRSRERIGRKKKGGANGRPSARTGVTHPSGVSDISAYGTG